MTDSVATTLTKPSLAFVGVGWIGLHRMKAILEHDCAAATLVADPSPSALEAARQAAPGASVCEQLDFALTEDVDGVVIASPSGLHAEQAIRALDAGWAVFCQKPLGRTAEETRAVLEAARRSGRLLQVDLSYRYARGMQTIREEVRAGAIGSVYSADLIFHNAYGPDKSWARKRELSGGGCAIDLGIHLVDLLLWTLEDVEVVEVRSALFRNGERLPLPALEVEDYAQAYITLSSGAAAHLACSWNFSAGRDAVIEVSFHGSEGTLSFSNVNGSFYDFRVELRRGSKTEVLVEPPDAWSGRAAVEWAKRLGADERYDAELDRLVEVAEVIDMMYGQSGGMA